MVRLKVWQWGVLALPLAAIVGFVAVAAGIQTHQWGINWIWAVIALAFVGWRWLLIKWLRPPGLELETVLAELEADQVPVATGTDLTQQAQAELQQVLQAARADAPPWQDWPTFFSRAQVLVAAIARIYYPQVKRPLLNIHVPQAYGLLHDTVDDVDRWMQKLSPALNQVTIGQAYEAYEFYKKLEPATRSVLKIWNWSQWFLNPVAAMTRTATQSYSVTANQQLIVNLGQILREQALQALGMRAIALYSGVPVSSAPVIDPPPAQYPGAHQTLQEILAQADSPNLEQKPINLLLVGRTGAGKSSLINTLFVGDRAAVDLLPSTEQLQDYRLETAGETLILWDAPGYEQIGRSRLQVLDQVGADALLLVTPATDPALQMDLNFLAEATQTALSVITIVTQVDRLRPIREWQPPYNWQQGDRPKERSIREAVQYRQEVLGSYCDVFLPLVTGDISQGREAWGTSALSEVLINTISPTKQLRLARFLRDLSARTTAAAKIIEQYAFQMSTAQGLASLLKSPVLSFISTLTTGSPTLAILLAEKIPVEQSPVVMGKLQMAYELFSLLSPRATLRDQPYPKPANFDLRVLWPLLLETSAPPDRDAWAFGHTLVEYWAHSLNPDQLQSRYHYYLSQTLLTSST